MSDLHHIINLDPHAVAHATSADRADRELKPREVLIPVISSGRVQLVRCQVLSSDTYHAPVNVLPYRPWDFTKTSDTGGTVYLGKVYIGGVDIAVSGFPANITGVVVSTIYWIAIDYKYATATWGSAAWNFGAGLPANSSEVEYWRVLLLECTSSIISGIYQLYPSDIHASLNP